MRLPVIAFPARIDEFRRFRMSWHTIGTLVCWLGLVGSPSQV